MPFSGDFNIGSFNVPTTLTLDTSPNPISAWVAAAAETYPPRRHLVVMEVHRGRWLMCDCKMSSWTDETPANAPPPHVARQRVDVAMRYAGAEFRRTAPARLRRLTAQRRMQAERKAARAYRIPGLLAEAERGEKPVVRLPEIT